MTMLCCGIITPKGSHIKHSENGLAVQTITNAETGQVVKFYSPARPRLLERMSLMAKLAILVGFLLTLYFQAGHALGASIITK